MIRSIIIKIGSLLLSNHTPRWIIFLIDVGIVAFSVVLAYFLRFNFQFPAEYNGTLLFIIPYMLFVRSLTFLIFQTYAGVVRYTSAEDIERIILVVSLGTVIFVAGNLLANTLILGTNIIPYGILVMEFLITIFLMTSSRLGVKSLYSDLTNSRKERVNVIIFGSGEFGVLAKNAVDNNSESPDRVVAFVDNLNGMKNTVGNKIEGIRIYSYTELESLIEKYNPSKLIIAEYEKDTQVKKEVIDICLQNEIKVLSVPNVNTWINGVLSFKQLKEINIDDLLGRDPIQLEDKAVKRQTINKTILVTGAAGSIGSEIVRQLTSLKPKRLILIDQAESPFYFLELELTEQYRFFNYEVLLADITDTSRMRHIFDTYHPDVVYHAAAYKHVPMMENNPREAINTNVRGTKVIADLSVEYEVQKFVMISTDKAVNPTNVMGASKRIAEMYIQSLNFWKNTSSRFITTRFGNVLGSNGSVIPRFKRQIENGGPVTVTHPEVTRFFMTIPEATQLVLEAAAMGRGGEIFIFDMGESVKIADLAKKMIKLSGLTLGKDIRLVYSGLRPGEKLYEELLASKENTIPTHHPKIMIAKVREYEFETVRSFVQNLVELSYTHDQFRIVKEMKSIVPEFKSENSIYEELDLDRAEII